MHNIAKRCVKDKNIFPVLMASQVLPRCNKHSSFHFFVEAHSSACLQSGHAGEFHPCIPTEPYGKVSLFMALQVKNYVK